MRAEGLGTGIGTRRPQLKDFVTSAASAEAPARASAQQTGHLQQEEPLLWGRGGPGHRGGLDSLLMFG